MVAPPHFQGRAPPVRGKSYRSAKRVIALSHKIQAQGPMPTCCCFLIQWLNIFALSYARISAWSLTRWGLPQTYKDTTRARAFISPASCRGAQTVRRLRNITSMIVLRSPPLDRQRIKHPYFRRHTRTSNAHSFPRTPKTLTLED